MSNKPIAMSKLKSIIYKLSKGSSNKSISKQFGISRNTVLSYKKKLEELNIDYSAQTEPPIPQQPKPLVYTPAPPTIQYSTPVGVVPFPSTPFFYRHVISSGLGRVSFTDASHYG